MGLYSEYLDWLLSSSPDDDFRPEKRAVFLIVSDLEDRCGLNDAWDAIDDSLRSEIISEWLEIIESTFS